MTNPNEPQAQPVAQGKKPASKWKKIFGGCAIATVLVLGGCIALIANTDLPDDAAQAEKSEENSTSQQEDKQAAREAKEAAKRAKEEERKAEEARKQWAKDNDDEHIAGMDQSTAMSICKQELKKRANHPETVKFDLASYREIPKSEDGSWWIWQGGMKADNSFGVTDHYDFECRILPLDKENGRVRTFVGEEELLNARLEEIAQVLEQQSSEVPQPEQPQQ